jgi:hypothetical protein
MMILHGDQLTKARGFLKGRTLNDQDLAILFRGKDDVSALLLLTPSGTELVAIEIWRTDGSQSPSAHHLATFSATDADEDRAKYADFKTLCDLCDKLKLH